MFGLLSFCFGILAGIPAFIYADRGLRDIDRGQAPERGRRLALAGIISAALGVYVMPILLIVGVVPFMRERTHRSNDTDNLHRIGEAMFAYSEDHKERF